jgi:hypothetical protein
MSVISTTIHRYSLRSRLRHSATRSGGPLPLRVARLIADLTNGTIQHPPRLIRCSLINDICSTFQTTSRI